MTITTKLWLATCAAMLLFMAGYGYGYHTRDVSAKLEASQLKTAQAEATKKLESEYRQKERQSAERTAKIETDYINDAARDEAEYRATIERLRSAWAGKPDGLRIKSSLTCAGSVHEASSSASSANAAPQGGLSADVAGRIIGVGYDADQVAMQLDALQRWVESECK